MTAGTQLEIKGITTWFGTHDTPEPLEGAEHFWARVQIFIGEVGTPNADSFDIFVCSPSMLAEYYAAEKWEEARLAGDTLPGGNVQPLTGVWLMRSWSRPDLERAVSRLIPGFGPGADFGTIAARIGRVAPWEFDYRWDDDINRAAGLPRRSHSFWHDEYRLEDRNRERTDV